MSDGGWIRVGDPDDESPPFEDGWGNVEDDGHVVSGNGYSRKQIEAASWNNARQRVLTFNTTPLLGNPQPEPTREPLPLYLGGPEPILGWRIWRVEVAPQTFENPWTGEVVKGGDTFLASVGQATSWPPYQALQAECHGNYVARALTAQGVPLDLEVLTERHRAPWPDGECECGVWAFNNAIQVEQALAVYGGNGFMGVNESNVWAIGLVKLWGRVVVCENGWRGEYAYPHSIMLRGNAVTPAIARKLEETYGVSVTISDKPIPSASGALALVITKRQARAMMAIGVNTQQFTQQMNAAMKTFGSAMTQANKDMQKLARRMKRFSLFLVSMTAFNFFIGYHVATNGWISLLDYACGCVTFVLALAVHRRRKRLERAIGLR